MLNRKSNWHGALDTFFVERRAVKFSYGAQDCCLFACDAVAAMTGIDIAYRFRGTYTTRKGAMLAGKKIAGSASVKAICLFITNEFQMCEVHPRLLQRGDVAMIQRTVRDCSLGVVSLNGRSIVVPLADGTGEVSIEMAVRGWRA